MTELTVQRFPWEPVPVEETVESLKRDFAYAVVFTAVKVHSKHEALQFVVNTRRGQIIPRGEGKLSDGSTVEFADLGMPQPKVETATVQELIQLVVTAAREMGLEVL